MPEPRGRDKRGHDRVRLTSSRSVWNLSEGGAYIATANPRRVGSVIHFEFTLENRESFKTLARVIRVLHKPNPKIGEPAGMALQFIEVGEEDKQRLRNYLRELQSKQKA